MYGGYDWWRKWPGSWLLWAYSLAGNTDNETSIIVKYQGYNKASARYFGENI